MIYRQGSISEPTVGQDSGNGGKLPDQKCNIRFVLLEEKISMQAYK
jgi:hypothetical protein